MPSVRKTISALVSQSLVRLKLPETAVEVSVPANPEHGDYATNVAMVLWKNPGLRPQLLGYKSPIGLAEKIVEELRALQKSSWFMVHGSWLKQKSNSRLSTNHQPPTTNYPPFSSITVAPPGFINFKLSENSLVSGLELWGRQLETGNWKLETSVSHRILVEFAHPNTHKAFHIGHLRNITTGESIVRLLSATGAKVVRANYQGDVGMHIAKALYGIISSLENRESGVEDSRPASRGPHPEAWNSIDMKAFTATWKTKPVKEKAEYLGKVYAAGSKAFEEDEDAKAVIKDLNAQIYAAAQQYARERGIDPGTTDYLALVKTHRVPQETVYELWKETRQWSLDYFDTVYTRVGSHFDRFYFESQCLAGVDIAKSAVKKGVLTESDGAVIFDGSPYNLDKRVFVNSLGLPTYEGKELKLALMETTEHGHLDRLIHVVGPEQASFFQVTFKAEELLGIQKDQQHHLIYGYVRLKEGKMSSRTGNVILGEWLLDEAKRAVVEMRWESEKSEIRNLKSETSSTLEASQNENTETSIDFTREEKEQIAETVAVAAVKYSFLKVSTGSDIAFDFKESINIHGDSGPYLQYTYARCRSVLRKAGEMDTSFQLPDSRMAKPETGNQKPETILNPEERAVAVLLARFPDVVEDAAANFAPNTLASYLFDLSQAYNLFYGKHSILQLSAVSWSAGEAGSQQSANFRLNLTRATANTLKAGLYLLGIETLERM